MNKKEALKIYNDTQMKMNAYNLLLNLASIDKSTIAPKKGSHYRNKMTSFMSGELYSIMTAPEYLEAVKFLSNEKINEVTDRCVYLSKKSLEDILNFSKEEVVEFDMLRMEAGDVWEEAKHKKDFKMFEPYLQKLFTAEKERAAKRDPKTNAYDLYLGDFEEGMTRKEYDKFFSLIKKELIPLIKKVAEKQEEVDDSFLYKYYPREKQALFMEEVKKYLGFDSSWGHMGESEHPVTCGLSLNDLRITTKYDEHNIAAAIYSVIHETGHATYEHQIDAKYEGTNIEFGISSGMHESQSRFFENYLGRRESFFVTLYPKLQELFPENLADVDLHSFMRAVNASKPSFVRTEADELTYPIHILIRYEIEKEIFCNNGSLEDLDKKWNEMYKEYLGLDVEDDAKGILQDIHWSDGMVGYFPTYALGSAIGAQIIHKMEQDIDVDGLLAKGKFSAVKKYLKQNVQHDGALHDYQFILERATGERFNPKYYINYLKKKYKTLYNIR